MTFIKKIIKVCMMPIFFKMFYFCHNIVFIKTTL